MASPAAREGTHGPDRAAGDGAASAQLRIPTTRTWVLTTGDESHGELYEQRVEYAPASPFPPMHRHPAQRELFEIEQGSMVYVVDGVERRVGAGETLEIGVGVPHKARNASDTEIATVRWETRPALRSQAFYTTAAKLGEAGMLEGALMAHEYRDVFRPSGLLGVVIPLVAAMARLLGRRLPDTRCRSARLRDNVKHARTGRSGTGVPG